MLLNTNVNLYKTFLEVYRTKNISKAASNLIVSQSAVSQNIKSLEEQLNTKLFKISTKRVDPTPEAESIYNDMKDAFLKIAQCEDNLKTKRENFTGTITIGIQSFLFNAILVKKIVAYSKLHPMVKFNILSGSTHNMLKMLDEENVDLVVDCSPIDSSNKNITIEHVVTMSNVFVSSTVYIPNTLNLNKLKHQRLIFSLKNSKGFTELKDICNLDGHELVFACSTENIIGLVKNGFGIGYVLKGCVEDEIALGRLKVLKTKNELPKTQIFICYNKLQTNNIVKDFIDHIKSTYK